MYQVYRGSVTFVDEATGEREVLLVVVDGCATFTRDDAPAEIEHLRSMYPEVDEVWPIAMDRLNYYKKVLSGRAAELAALLTEDEIVAALEAATEEPEFNPYLLSAAELERTASLLNRR
jgi:hypothetical protein